MCESAFVSGSFEDDDFVAEMCSCWLALVAEVRVRSLLFEWATAGGDLDKLIVTGIDDRADCITVRAHDPLNKPPRRRKPRTEDQR